jgi:hypothetical protein
MADLKHVGRSVNNQRKCFVAYRVVPNEPENCLVVFSDSLDAADHDSVIKVVESNAGQNADELADAMIRNTLSDGRNMLQGLHMTGKIVKMPTKDIELTPNTRTTVNLAELNELIAEQRGVSVEDLAVQPTTKTQTNEVKETETNPVVEQTSVNNDSGVLSDEDLAAQYRSQADAMFKEAKRLREQAEELVPTKKKAKVKTTESA